ncbi:MAG: FeoA family protein [Brevefilum sp.]
MNLLVAPKNKIYRIVAYNGGRRVEFKLRQLGLSPGRKIKVIRYAPMGGPIMLDVEGRTVAIGRGIAARVEIEAL